jgi:hypothetical protein
MGNQNPVTLLTEKRYLVVKIADVSHQAVQDNQRTSRSFFPVFKLAFLYKLFHATELIRQRYGENSNGVFG